MSRAKVIVLSLLAVFAVSAVASASASALEWKVNGASLGTGTAAISSTANLTGAEELSWNGIAVKCSALTISSGLLEQTIGNSAEKLSFKSCVVTTPAKCVVTTGEINTLVGQTIKSELLTGSKVKFVPWKEGAEATNFAKFKLANKSEAEVCSVKGEYTVHGSATGEIENPSAEATEKVLNFTSTSGSKLEVGIQKAELITKAGLTLVSGLKFTGV